MTLQKLFVLFCCLLTLTNMVSVSGLNWGESCSGDPYGCDETKFLECDKMSRICRCQNEKTSYYDETDQKCHKLVGAQCGGSTEDPMPCPLNAACDIDSDSQVCRCNVGFVVTSTLKCARPYGEECIQNSHCDSDSFVLCSEEGTCKCNLETSIYNPVKNKCLLQAGQKCDWYDDNSQQCTAGSACQDWGTGHWSCQCQPGETTTEGGECRMYLHGECSQELLCDDQKFFVCNATGNCNCKDGLYDGGNWDCLAGFDISCAEGERCDPSKFLACSSPQNKCLCRDGTMDIGMGICKSILNSQCGGDDWPECNAADYLDCVASNCVCRDGSSENSNGQCRVGDGGLCHENLPCDESLDLVCGPDGKCYPEGALAVLSAGQFCNPMDDRCDHLKFLYCDPMTIRCTCTNSSEIIEDSVGNCRRRANTICSPDKEGAQQCTENSKCTQIGSTHRCFCDAGLTHNSAGRCVFGYGAECVPRILPELCDRENLQFCNPQESRCDCFDVENMEYDFVSEKCFLKANSPCLPGSVVGCRDDFDCDEATQTCVQNWLRIRESV